MTTRLAALAATALLLGTLSGCGGDGDVDSFCGSYAQLQRDNEDIITVEQGLEEVENLADTAPDAVKEEAETARDGYQAIADAVEGAGFELSALDETESLTEEEQTELAAAAQEADYSPEELSAAFQAIDAWSLENCPAE